MKTQLTLIIFFVCFVLKAQNNPYASFGYESEVKYETNISSLLTIHNADTNSIYEKIAFDFERKFIYFLNAKDSILETDSFEEGDIMIWLSVDPLASEYPSLSPYSFVANSPIENQEVDGRYWVGTDGKKVDFTINESGSIVLGNNATNDLKRIVQLTNMTKSETAQSQLMKVASNSTKVHFEIETNPVSSKKSLLGLHRVHDEEGKILEWDKETNTYKGTPAYLIDEEGNTVYKEATITIYLNHIYKNHDKLKYLRSDYGSTLNEILVDVTAHETDHNLNPNSINAVIENQKGNNTGFDVEAPAYLLQEKVYKEVKQNRGK